MSIEQHAEAAVKDVAETYRAIGHMEGIGHPVEWAAVIIAKHMQSAIDEATAPLRARIAELEGLGPLIEEYADSGIVMANAIHTKSPERQKRASERRREALAKINAILKGGAS